MKFFFPIFWVMIVTFDRKSSEDHESPNFYEPTILSFWVIAILKSIFVDLYLFWKIFGFHFSSFWANIFLCVFLDDDCNEKNICPKIQKMKSKNFPEKIQVQKNRFSNRYNSKTKDRRHIKVGWFVILTRFPIEWYYHNSKNKKKNFHLYMNFFSTLTSIF